MVRVRSCVRFAASFVLMTGCANPLDFFGVEERVLETETQEDDEDLSKGKHLDYDLGRTVVENFNGCDFLLNKSQSLTRLSLQEFNGKDKELDGVLFRTRADALSKLGDRTVIPSMEVVNGSLRPFMDGLYAAVELVVERGTKGSPVNKRAVFDEMLTELLSRSAANASNGALRDVAADFAAAQRIAGDSGAGLPSDLENAVNDRLSTFERDPFLAKPIGYHAWLPDLQTIFRRDHLLMHGSPQPAAVSEVVDLFAARPDLQNGYDAVLQTYAGLANPVNAFTPIDVAKTENGTQGDPGTETDPGTQGDPGTETDPGTDPGNKPGVSGARQMAAFLDQHPDYGKACNQGFRWIPELSGAEARLYGRMACRSASTTTNWMDALVQAIQSGDIDLTPTKQSGFYERQIYALETLLVPDRGTESQHLALTRAYKEKLVANIKTVFTRTTDTSAKQLFILNPDIFEWKSAYIYPRLQVEPFPTFYLRTARAYAFLRNFLTAVLGAGTLDKTPRVLEGGKPASASIGTELNSKIRLLYGLHLLAASSIGMRDELSDDEKSTISTDDAETEAKRWLESWKKDPDVLSDPRMIVPLARDDRVATYWVTAGVKVLRMHASFLKGTEPQVVASLCTTRGFVPFEPYMIVEQTFQVTLPASSPPLTPDEFRAIADRNPTIDGLRGALGALQ